MPNLIASKDLIKGQTYYLTGEHQPHIGEAVRLKNRVKASLMDKGKRGFGAIVQSTATGETYYVGPKGFLFSEAPAVEGG